MVTKQDIAQLLRQFEIKRDDTVLIHSSMRSTGGVEGGCDAVIDAFCEYLSDGLFLVPAHTWDRVDADHPFDVRSTLPCTGALSTVAVGRADGVRSLHPTHSLVAFGKRAHEFVQGEEKATSPGFPGGCWARLYDEDARILLLGVGHDRNTYIHAVDEMMSLPDRLSDPISLRLYDYAGTEHLIPAYRRHKGCRHDYFVNYKKPLEELGAVTYGKLGNATVYCCRARLCAQIIMHIWKNTDHDLNERFEEIPTEYYADFHAGDI